MSTFVKPSELKAALPKPTDSICEQLKSQRTFLDLVAKAQAWMFDDGGSLSPDMQALICNLPCLGGSGTTTTSTGSGGTTSTGAGSGSVPGQVTLRVSKGFFASTHSLNILVVWNKDGLATMFDIFRGTVNDPDDAGTTKIVSNGTPFTIGQTATSPLLWDNGDHYAFADTVQSGGVLYYYWVVPKNANGSGTKSLSGVTGVTSTNGGWAAERAPYNYIAGIVMQPASGPYTIPAGVHSLRVIGQGGGGAGAGGGETHGGGGGGGPATAILIIPVSPGDVLQVYDSNSLDNTGVTGSEASGLDGSNLLIKLNTVLVATVNGGKGGVYSASANGAGGDPGSGGGINSGGGSLEELYNGFGGTDASGGTGGPSGCPFGHPRKQAKHKISFNPAFDNLSDSGESDGGAGGGSMATNNPNNIPVATGGSGGGGYAVIQFSA